MIDFDKMVQDMLTIPDEDLKEWVDKIEGSMALHIATYPDEVVWETMNPTNRGAAYSNVLLKDLHDKYVVKGKTQLKFSIEQVIKHNESQFFIKAVYERKCDVPN